MRQPVTALRAASVAALLALGGAAQAAITVYTDEASFLAAVSGAATDSFDDLTAGAPYVGPLARSAGSYGYSVSAGAESSTLYGAGSAADAWLSTNAAVDTLTFSGFATPVGTIGANVFASNVDGEALRFGRVVVTATDAGGTVTQLVRRANTETFIGFVSDSSILSFTVTAEQGAARNRWPTVNDLTLANPVPEPGTYAMLLAGLGVVGLLARRRRVV